MELVGVIDIQSIQHFISVPVSVAIQSNEGEQAQFVRKTIQKIEWCPEQTHIRIYFDHFNFFAIPASSQTQQTDLQWSAFDAEGQLFYLIRKESVTL